MKIVRTIKLFLSSIHNLILFGFSFLLLVSLFFLFSSNGKIDPFHRPISLYISNKPFSRFRHLNCPLDIRHVCRCCPCQRVKLLVTVERDGWMGLIGREQEEMKCFKRGLVSRSMRERFSRMVGRNTDDRQRMEIWKRL